MMRSENGSAGIKELFHSGIFYVTIGPILIILVASVFGMHGCVRQREVDKIALQAYVQTREFLKGDPELVRLRRNIVFWHGNPFPETTLTFEEKTGTPNPEWVINGRSRRLGSVDAKAVGYFVVTNNRNVGLCYLEIDWIPSHYSEDPIFSQSYEIVPEVSPGESVFLDIDPFNYIASKVSRKPKAFKAIYSDGVIEFKYRYNRENLEESIAEYNFYVESMLDEASESLGVYKFVEGVTINTERYIEKLLEEFSSGFEY